MEAKTAAKELFSNEETPDDEQIETGKTDDDMPIDEAIKSVSSEEEDNNQEQHSSGQMEGEITQEHPALAGLSGRATLPLETAAEIIGCEVKHVQALRNQGKLKHAPRARDMITVASIKNYLNLRRKPRISTPTPEQRPDLKIVG
jgi:hypothetical protein